MPITNLGVLEVIATLIGICIIAVLFRYRMRQRVEVVVPRTVSVDDMRIKSHSAYPLPDMGELVKFIGMVHRWHDLDSMVEGEKIQGGFTGSTFTQIRAIGRLAAGNTALVYYAIFSGCLNEDEIYMLVRKACQVSLLRDRNPDQFVKLGEHLRERSSELPADVVRWLVRREERYGW